jgi:hypothetical protein
MGFTSFTFVSSMHVVGMRLAVAVIDSALLLMAIAGQRMWLRLALHSGALTIYRRWTREQ